MKKLFLILTILAVSLSPFSVFANQISEEKPFGDFEPKPNKYGVSKYDERLKIYSNFNIEQENAKYNGKWVSNYYDPMLKFGGTMCDPATQRAFGRYSGSEDLIIKACQKWLNPDSKNQSFVIQYDKSTKIASGVYYFLESSEDSQDLEVKIGRDDMFVFESKKSNINLHSIHIEIHNAGCYSWAEDCNFHNGNIMIYAYTDQFQQNHRFNEDRGDYDFFYDRYFFGKHYTGIDYIPLFNTFKTIYPDDFEEDYKPARSRPIPESEKPKLEDFYPRASVSIKDKHLDAIILNLNSKGENALNITQTRPSFSIYDEKKEREIFTYHGSNLTDRFIYDFENHGKYYLKTIVTQPPPLIVGEGKYKIHQPVWTEILIDGGTYSIFPHGEASDNCVGDTCTLPDSAKSCVGRFQDIGGSVGCEFHKLNDFLKSKLGFLWAPVDILTRTASNFQNANIVSCSVRHDPININACPISEKFPQLYAFLNMAANGWLLFGFVMFLRNQLSGFVSERGDA